jgi:hypothetical protein
LVDMPPYTGNEHWATTIYTGWIINHLNIKLAKRQKSVA